MKYKWLKIVIIFFMLFCCLSSAQAFNLKDAFKVDDSTVTDPTDVAAYEAGYGVEKKAKGTHLDVTLATIIQIGLTFLGIAFVLLIIYGGVLWMTDQGNEEQVAKAKKIIKNSLIGLVIVIMAYAISWLIITTFSSEALQPPLDIER